LERLTVFVVDDEHMVREHFEKLFPWDQAGLHWVGDAPDGETALERCRTLRPNLVIADITMPGMSGIELLGHLKRELPETRCVVLTCHQDFGYVQTALRLGALDYMVKAATTPKEMLDALQRVRSRLAASMQEGPTLIARQQWLVELLRGRIQSTRKEAADPSGVGLPLDNNHVRVLMVQAEGDLTEDETAAVRSSADLQRALEDAATVLGRSAWAPLGPRTFALVGTFAAFRSESDSGTAMAQAYQEVKSRWNHAALLTAGLSGPHPRLADACAALAEAEHALASRFYAGKGRLILQQPSWRSVSHELQTDLDRLAASPLPAGTPFARHADSITSRAVTICRDHWIAPQQARLLMTGLVRRLVASLDVSVSRWDMDLWPMQAEQAVTAQDLQAWALQVVGTLTTSSENKGLRPEIRRVVSQIRGNLSAPYDLAWAADLAGLHPNYFSAVFREETGLTFTEYLSRLRMERAAEYLRQGTWKTQQIADMVGVPNYRTFFKMFQRVMGTGPAEYRRHFGH